MLLGKDWFVVRHQELHRAVLFFYHDAQLSVSTSTAVFDSFALHGNAVSAFGFQYVSCTFAVTPFTKLMRITSGVIGVMRKMPYMLAISTADFLSSPISPHT